MDVDISGLIDMHVHSGPDTRPRRQDDVELARSAARVGMRAILIKSHITLTADRATIAEKMVPGIRVRGGLALNREVGGLNPAAVAAIHGPQDWLRDVVPELQTNRDIAYTAVCGAEPLPCAFPKSGAYLFVNISRLGADDEAVCERLLFEAGIPTVAGRYFQTPGYLRLPFGGDTATIRDMGQALQQWVRGAGHGLSREMVPGAGRDLADG